MSIKNSITPFTGEDGRYHFIYKITNLINGNYYKGMHSTDDLNDGYMGSGKALLLARKKYGRQNFSLEIEKFFKNRKDALIGESEYITENDIDSDNCYNLCHGGNSDENLFDKIQAIDKNGNHVLVSKYDERFKTGELKSIHCGKAIVCDSNGNTMQIDVNDPRYLSGELKSIALGKVSVIDKDGNTFQVDRDDPRFISGELRGVNIGKAIVKDRDGNVFQVDVNDPRYLNGELVGHTVGKVAVYDQNGNTLQVSTDDPRFLSGEYKQVNCGKVVVKDKNGKILQVDKDDPRFLSGELKGMFYGLVNVRDKDGNIFHVNKDEPRIKSGELEHIYKGRIRVIDKEGNVFFTYKTDPKFLTGEYTLIRNMCQVIKNINDKEVCKRVLFSQIQEYLSDGWKIKFGHSVVLKLSDDGYISKIKRIETINTEQYLLDGWICKSRDLIVEKNNKFKNVIRTSIATYLNDGWKQISLSVDKDVEKIQRIIDSNDD